jgi:hypothetical protein
MVLLHHELEVVFDDGHPSEQHTATLLELGETSEQGTELLVRLQSAMARTVGLPVAIAAQVNSGTLLLKLWNLMQKHTLTTIMQLLIVYPQKHEP